MKSSGTAAASVDPAPKVVTVKVMFIILGVYQVLKKCTRRKNYAKTQKMSKSAVFQKPKLIRGGPPQSAGSVEGSSCLPLLFRCCC